MKMTINTSDFITAIKNLEKVNVNNVLPILDSVQITVDSHFAVLSRTNLGKTIISKIPADIEFFGTILLPMKTIDLIKNLKDDSFVLTEDSIITDKKKIGFTRLNLSEYPEIKIDTKEFFFEISESELHRMLEVKYCMAQDENRPILCGVCFDNNKTIGVDGYRMSVRQGNYNSELKKVVIDSETIDLISKIINKKSNNIVKIYGKNFHNNDKQFIKFEFINQYGYNTVVIGETVCGEFLNHKGIIPTDFETTVTVNADDISNEIEFMNKASNKDANDYIKFITNDNKLITDCRITESVYDKDASREATIKAQKNSDLEYYEKVNKARKTTKVPERKTIKEIKIKKQIEVNRITSEVDAEVTGKVWESSFNGKYLYEGFKFYNNTQVKIKAISHIAPMVITADDCNLELVLPVRVA